LAVRKSNQIACIQGNNKCDTIFEFSVENAKIVDWLAERGEFELPVPISEQPDNNMTSGSGAQTKCRGRPRLKRLLGLYGPQHSKETFPSRVISDIATDVAAAIR
jgi:hypothetical protein